MQSSIAHNLEEKTRTKDVILEENGLTECGFRKPSPIQFKAIPLGRCGFDLIVKSKSGTGKTLVFSTVVLEAVNVSKNNLQVLILVPTREIAVQIQDVLRTIGRFIEGLVVESFIGGLPIEEDVKKVKHCHIAVGAPGRVKHLINLGALSTESIHLFILDEADKLMEPTFQDDINEIYNTLPQRKQMIVSSATYPHELDTFLTNYMLSPSQVSSENETPVLLGLKQFVSIIKTNNPNVVQLMRAKNESLVEIFSKVSFTQCLVFSNYQTRAESVSNYLNQKGWESSFISAAQSQAKRLEAINNLKEFKSRILLSTDLTARGIDAPNVDLVVNYDIPQDAVTYLHRMGRAGRYGSLGICINLASLGEELTLLQNVLGSIGATLSISVLPTLNGNCDLWQLDPSGLEQISGTVLDATNNEDIKKEVLALKQTHNNKHTKLNKKKVNKKIQAKEKLDAESVNDILDKNKKELEEDCEKFSSLDTETLLNSLASDTVKFDNDKKDTGSVELLHSLANGLIKLDNDENKKRKRDSDGNKEFHKEKRKNDSKQAVFCKNRALLTITRLLSEPHLIVDLDMVNSISEYLSVLKEEEDVDSKNNSVAEILHHSNEDRSSKQVQPVENQDVIESIFKLGYECAVGKQNKNWLDCLPKDEFDRFQQLENVISSTDSEEDEEEDYEMEDYTEENDASNGEIQDEENQDIALQWVPVVQKENEGSSDLPNEQFTKCYEDCSNVLWQNGLTFETVEDFDNWYYQWQEQLQSVRSYVQQNIYVQEMSKYQQSLANK